MIPSAARKYIYHEEPDIVLLHGDCTEILPLFEPKSVDLVLTDPPYGHNNNNGDLISRWEAALGVGGYSPEMNRPIANDGKEANALVRWVFAEIARLLSAGSCCCCCCGGGPDPQFARWSLWLDEVLTFKQMVVWDKGPMGMGWHYRRSYETVLVAEKTGAKCKWYDTTRKVENIIRHIPKIIPQKTDHPTPKPVELFKHFIGLHTEKGHLVLDPFLGSGTTAVACKQLGRKCIGIELDAKYLDIAIDRLRQGRLI